MAAPFYVGSAASAALSTPRCPSPDTFLAQNAAPVRGVILCTVAGVGPPVARASALTGFAASCGAATRPAQRCRAGRSPGAARPAINSVPAAAVGPARSAGTPRPAQGPGPHPLGP